MREVPISPREQHLRDEEERVERVAALFERDEHAERYPGVQGERPLKPWYERAAPPRRKPRGINPMRKS